MKQRNATRPPWTLTVPVADLPETGRRIEISADETTRAATAEAIGVRSIDRLDGTFDLTRDEPDVVHVTGRVSATIGQLCVVSLEPLQSEVEEDIDLLFRPPEPGSAPVKGMGERDDEGEPVAVAATATDEPPEIIRDGAVDLGAIATEFLILGIDPYPRKPGVAFEPPAVEADPASHPFAALAALKKSDGK